MGEVTVRRYACAIHKDNEGAPFVVADPAADEFSIVVPLARVANTNALATPIRGPMRYVTRQHELRLLLSYVDDPSAASLTLRRAEFQSSALHIRRFVSEAAGLGLLTGVVEVVLGWRRSFRRLNNFDALPSHMARRYPSKGIRPDLLFSMDAAYLAGEARGRSDAPSRSVRKDQMQRLDDLAAWSSRHRNHPVVMSWAWITETGITVDLFDFPQLLRRHGLVLEPPPEVERTEIVESTIPSFSQRVRERQTRTSRPAKRRVDVAGPELLFHDSAETADSLIAGLYGTAPRGAPQQHLFGRQVRGEWARADIFGRVDKQLFFGVLESRPEGNDFAGGASLYAQDRNSERDHSVQTALTDRLLIVVAEGSTPPSWDRVQEAIQ